MSPITSLQIELSFIRSTRGPATLHSSMRIGSARATAVGSSARRPLASERR
jgi:hypothetical protein